MVTVGTGILSEARGGGLDRVVRPCQVALSTKYLDTPKRVYANAYTYIKFTIFPYISYICMMFKYINV